MPWHQDATYFGLAPFEHVTAWVALTDSTPENGCVQIIPHSHTTGQRPHFDQPDPKTMLSRGQTLADAIGGDFKRIPACRSRSQTGCVVAYSSFLDPPPADSLNQYSAHCQYKNGISWLQVNVIPHPGDPRPVVTQSLGPTWGLHLDDVNLSLGNLVSLVKSQAKAYTQAH